MKTAKIIGISHEGGPYCITGAGEVEITYQTARGKVKKLRLGVTVDMVPPTVGAFNAIRLRFKRLAEELAASL